MTKRNVYRGRNPDTGRRYFQQETEVVSKVKVVDDPGAPEPSLDDIPPWERKAMGVFPVSNPAARSLEGQEKAEERAQRNAVKGIGGPEGEP